MDLDMDSEDLEKHPIFLHEPIHSLTPEGMQWALENTGVIPTEEERISMIATVIENGFPIELDIINTLNLVQLQELSEINSDTIHNHIKTVSDETDTMIESASENEKELIIQTYNNVSGVHEQISGNLINHHNIHARIEELENDIKHALGNSPELENNTRELPNTFNNDDPDYPSTMWNVIFQTRTWQGIFNRSSDL